MLKLLSNIPNIISLLRILLAPIFIVCLSNGFRKEAATIFVIGAVSDFLDGYIARKMGTTSNFGKILDPVTDKIFANTAVWGVFLFCDQSIGVLIVAIILGLRDCCLLIVGGYIVIKKINLSMQPIYVSKVCTALLFLWLALVILMPQTNIFLHCLRDTTIATIGITSWSYVVRLKKLCGLKK
jgi:CDP-diacylglycerol--glycerol-3-phosphate 3-phosphatidyltransferase